MIRTMLNRRKLLALLGLSSAAASVGTSATAAEPTASGGGAAVKLLFTCIAGTAYYKAAASLPTLNVGDPVRLRREPSNGYDKRAIEVFDMTGRKLGYIARTDNNAIARMMDAGELFTAEVARLDREHWDIRVDVFWLRPY